MVTRKPTPAKPKSIAEAVRELEPRAALEALRDRLAAELDREVIAGHCELCNRGSTSIAPLAKQLTDVLKTLAGMAVPEDSKVEEISKRRQKRRAAAVRDRTASADVGGPGGDRARGKRGTAPRRAPATRS